MKSMRKNLTLIAILLIPLGLLAQKQIKLGHMDSQALLMAMPEMDSVQKKLQKIAQDYEATLEELQVELNSKFEKYQKDLPTMTDLIRSTKESELNELNERMQNFQAQAQQDMANKRTELLRPIQEKAKKAVDEVAEEHGFTYVFDTGPGVGAVIYSAPETEDILPLVKKKLGITD
jgi:outer membrane protein